MYTILLKAHLITLSVPLYTQVYVENLTIIMVMNISLCWLGLFTVYQASVLSPKK